MLVITPKASNTPHKWELFWNGSSHVLSRYMMSMAQLLNNTQNCHGKRIEMEFVMQEE